MNIAERHWRPLFSPCKYIRQVPTHLVYDTVRYVMWRWGRIYFLRVDNGSPFGDPTRQAFSALHLCLVAHGVYLRINPPRSPTRNAKVERNQGTLARWIEPQRCRDYIELQEKLNEAVQIQREVYPSRVCQGRARIEAYPGLLTNSAGFNPADFEAARVHRLLAKGTWKRLVTSTGVAYIFRAPYSVGRSFQGHEVLARLDIQTKQWVFLDKQENELKRLDLKNLNPEDLIKLLKIDDIDRQNSMSQNSS